MLKALGSTSHNNMEAARISSDLCCPEQNTFLLPCYRVASSLVKWLQQALCQEALLQLFVTQLGAAELLVRLSAHINLQVITDLHRTCTTEAMWRLLPSPLPQEWQYAKEEQNNVVKLPLPSADYKNPLRTCQ